METTGRCRVVVATSAGARTGPIAAVPRPNAVPTRSVPSNVARRARYAASDSSWARAAGPGTVDPRLTETVSPGSRALSAGVVVGVNVEGSPAGGTTVVETSDALPPSERSWAAKSSPNRKSRRTGTFAGVSSNVETFRMARTWPASRRNATWAEVSWTTAAYPHEASAPGWATVPSIRSLPDG